MTYSSDEYKRQIMNDLATGNTGELPVEPTQEYHDFDDFAQRSSVDERRQIFSQSLHPERISTDQMQPELQQAISKIKPNERDDVAREFFKRLKERGISESHLQQQLGLSSHNPNHMSADDVSKVANFAYHNYPDIFQGVLADKPAIIKFLSNPLIAAVLGVMAAKWLSGRRQ